MPYLMCLLSLKPSGSRLMKMKTLAVVAAALIAMKWTLHQVAVKLIAHPVRQNKSQKRLMPNLKIEKLRKKKYHRLLPRYAETN